MDSNREESKTIQITEKDVKNSWLLHYIVAEVGISYERLQALGLTVSLLPVLRKLYKTKSDIADAMRRHLVFFNTEAVFGSLINGIVISMEEQKARGEDINTEAITGIKTGLMGPLAGIGDSIDWATFKPIIFALAATLSAKGNPLGAFVLLVLPMIQIIIGRQLSAFGYRTGRDSVTELLSSGRIQQLITAAKTLGLYMMGALSSTYIAVTTPVKFVFGQGNAPFVLQKVLDSIAPGLIPLAIVFFIYWWLNHKNQNLAVVVLLLVAIALVGSFIGVLAPVNS
ncbi:PTS system mannose/fructose/sorbose family transporter subunit IID [Sporolactobacillus sp. CQH2019]|uniref:PTS system mannose/fructose/sorbose family transporter subunit IID n=1 Tax=Sporolactobacillus sp. CQH2019 TaxID=3023512 RepID=UPI002367C9DD|nr:PTS system mannose/fructose/sorbose family transporter subunit IID [Sporolactobacillus sp. CQH2019]MDD9148887.1 PTS system mannose/fructose/sorbose family transporter subunit IID [Sporolactobacillus sp. CQH2019]